MRVADIREQFRQLRGSTVDTRGGATVEIIGASFLADEVSIFGEVNEAYVAREFAWYKSQSLSLNTFPGGAPKVWRECGGEDGSVNSNYGWCLFSKENGYQYNAVLRELRREPASRRAVAIYTRPSMHIDAVANGRQDFICTNAVSYLLRDGCLSCVVQMRSSDAVLGYRNDRVWHLHVLQWLASELSVEAGAIYWQAASLHVYARDWRLM